QWHIRQQLTYHREGESLNLGKSKLFQIEPVAGGFEAVKLKSMPSCRSTHRGIILVMEVKKLS
ncbi:MAG: hypothetical protein JW913_04605, partial [Chitinispirillaceae bacterium]|nr:hypothetical protein [Chitinispirillaceae bacterium]